MDPVEVSRRLKAARWLVGGLKPNGRPQAMTVEELATHPVLMTNRISKNRLEEFEQAKTTPRRLELVAIGEAFGLPDWFDGDHDVIPADATAVLEQLIGGVDQVLQQTEEESPPEEDGKDHPGEAGANGGA